MKQKEKIVYMAAIIISLTLGALAFTAAAKKENSKNDNSKSEHAQNNKDKSEADNGTETEDSMMHGQKKITEAELTDYVKPNKSEGETDASVHQKKTQGVTQNLQKAAKKEQEADNTEVSDAIQEVADDQAETQTQTTQAMAQVENRNRIKTFLLGTDYKNLGQLRSSLSHNENDIRKLTKTLSQTTDAITQTDIENQLQTLMQERTRIQNVIATNQGSLSLFGWLSRLMSGYTPVATDDQAEAQLTTDVQNAINNEPDTTTDSTDTTDTTSNTSTDTTSTDTTATGTTDNTTTATDNTANTTGTTDNSTATN